MLAVDPMQNICFLEVIIVNHFNLVQLFETMQSEAEGSELQEPGVALAQGLPC